MSDPFKSDYLYKDVGGTFASFASKQIKDCDVGDSILIDCAGRDVIRTRSALRFEAEKLNMKFKTKTDSTGDLWVKRVS